MSSETTKEAAAILNKSRRRSSSASASAFASAAAPEKTTKPSLGATRKDKVIPRQLVPRVNIEVPRPIVVARKHTKELKRMPLKATAMNPASKKQPSLGAKITNATRPSITSAKPNSTATSTSTALLHPVRRSIPGKMRSKEGLPDLLGGTSQLTRPQDSAAVRSAKLNSSIATVSLSQLVPVTPEKPDIYIDPDMDLSDPQMCSEYAQEIYSYLLGVERKDVYLIEGEFLNSSTYKVKAPHRSVLIDWLIQVQQRFKLLSDTMYLCVDILDRIVQLEPSLPKSKLQLVGVAALFIAAKYEEIYPPTLTELVYLTDSTYTKAEVLTKEIDILKKLDYQFNRPHGITFLRRYSTIMGTTTRIHNLAKYILELSLLDHSCSSLLPSKKAAAALFLSKHIMTPYTSPLSIWDEAMAYNTKYRIADFQSEKLKLKRSLREGHSNPKIKTVREKFTSSVLASATTRMALNRI